MLTTDTQPGGGGCSCQPTKAKNKKFQCVDIILERSIWGEMMFLKVIQGDTTQKDKEQAGQGRKQG